MEDLVEEVVERRGSGKSIGKVAPSFHNENDNDAFNSTGL